ncbi:metal ABC transporter ATP-binding protein [Modestobacter versicolor]|uniref:ABC transporter ATP-binding protein n=1 Tax=Modestobacter versicolor TaxID=429133 RepID=A0A323V6V6_9ACTN|nr:ATP-binding cassette domain-containing protein [Modestobacter versicolor]MBB3674979.1 zinc/manganese transport system ATP-binding protein [Modestobacter versicolor]PZA20617.1 ABC transporter ATP-binding protein [Modestobacter versicolor]
MSAPLSARGAAVRFGDRVLWSDLDVDVQPGEFLAVLGPNGAGKSTFLKAALGQQPLSAGELQVAGRPPGRADRSIGYVPQQKSMGAATPLRARDLVGLGIDGDRYGVRRRSRADRARIDEALGAVGAAGYADAPIGLLSGGEQQRVRIAQALVGDPQLLLCDEPLLSLDLGHQRAVTGVIDRRRREHGTAVVFVTHEINPVLGLVDRVLYIAAGRHRLGTPAEVFTSESLSDLYRTPVDVLTVQGRVVVVGTPEHPSAGHHDLPPALQVAHR